MEIRRKVTYTLDRDIIDHIRIQSRSLNISHSGYVAQSILMGLEMMMEGYDENNQQPIIGVVRKRPHTIPITLTLPIEVADALNGFSHILNVKKSHLVRCCIRNREIEDEEPFFRLVREFMASLREP
jgi:hypothetical protein